MNKKFVNTLYEKLMTLDNGVQQIKFDLQIHSPASKDFCGSSKKTELECFQAILNESIANELRIIAITDHNTFAGYNKIGSRLA